MRPIRIAPSILSADFTRLGDELRAAEAAGSDFIHFDVMDGRFVPNISFGLPVLQAARGVTPLPLDVHLMIVEPDHLLADFAAAGANRITVHYEACPMLHATLQTIRRLGCSAGVALNPHTPASLISEVIDIVDLVLVMTVNPGFGGQKLIPQTLKKIAAVRRMIEETGRAIDLLVDGGINETTAAQVVGAGADVLVGGSAIFSKEFSVAAGVERLRRAAQG